MTNLLLCSCWGTSPERPPHSPQAEDLPSPCVLPYLPPWPLLSNGIMLVSGLFSSCCFFKALSYGGRGSSFGACYLLVLVLPSSSRTWPKQLIFGVPTKTFSSTNNPVPQLACVQPPDTRHTLMVPCPCLCRSIRCLRNIIHWNLITAFILRNATWFVVQLTMNPEVHESNVVGAALPGSQPKPSPEWLGCVGSLRNLKTRPQKQFKGPSRAVWWLENT